MAAAVILCMSKGLQNKQNDLTNYTTVMTCICFIFTATVLKVLEVGWQYGTCRIRLLALSGNPELRTFPKVAFQQRGFSQAHKHAIFTHGAPQSADRMALYTPGYTGIKQGLLLQAPHRIPNTMEPRTSVLAVTSFLDATLFLWCISFQT